MATRDDSTPLAGVRVLRWWVVAEAVLSVVAIAGIALASRHQSESKFCYPAEYIGTDKPSDVC